MNNDFQNDIKAVNQTFDDVLANFKNNYVNFHTNAMLSLPSSPPPSSSSADSTDGSVKVKAKAKAAPKAAAAPPDPNDAALMKYRHAANQLLEKVRSQIGSNSKNISSINANISPIQKAYLHVVEAGTTLDQTKSAAVVSLEDYDELYRTTVFGTIMYVIGAGLILYSMYKPRIQSEF
jgi:hypothetical protein